jgi:hypothetical protein
VTKLPSLYRTVFGVVPGEKMLLIRELLSQPSEKGTSSAKRHFRGRVDIQATHTLQTAWRLLMTSLSAVFRAFL